MHLPQMPLRTSKLKSIKILIKYWMNQTELFQFKSVQVNIIK